MIGRTLGRYQVVEQIGAGGMGVVYRARDARLERDVALKVLPEGSLRDEAARKRFHKEALALSRLNHPNIQTIHDFDTQDGVDFLVTEYVPGNTLDDQLRGGPLSEKEILECATQIADGLASAHDHGIVHRDLKPANIRLTPQGRVKILDFGLAILAQAAPEAVTAATLSQMPGGAGTVPYMAPEQLRNEPLDPRADLYSLGLVLYEMATGQHPFPHGSTPAVIGAILHESPKPPSARNARISPALEQIILKLLEKDREHRYASARDLLAELRRVSAGGPVVPVAGGPASVLRGRTTAIAAIVVVALAVAAGLLWRMRPPARPEAGAAPTRPALAVLPFRPLSGQPADSELGLGLADAIVTGLGGSLDLTVRPTRAVLSYQDKLTDPIEAGKALQVSVVLDGTLQKAGGRLRINVQLWQVSDGTSLWSQKYDVESADVFKVQDEIGARVAQALRVRLTAAARERLSTPYSTNPDVYALIVRARGLELRMGRDTLQAAISLYEEALRKDPANAQAHAWLASACRIYSFLHDPNNPTWLEKAEGHARRARELDPNLAEAYAAEAAVLWTPQRRFQHDRASALYRKALELNPNLATDRGFYAVILSHLGLFDRAATEYRRALETDPENVRALAEVAEDYVMRGQPRRGEEAARVALRVDPDYPLSKMALLEALIAQDKLDDAQALLAQDYFGAARYFSLWFSGLVAAKRGRFAEAESLGQQAVKQGEGLGPYHHLTYGLAQIYALSGKKAEAVRWLRRTAEEGMPAYPMFRDDPMLKNLRGDPEYEKLLGELRRDWERRRNEF